LWFFRSGWSSACCSWRGTQSMVSPSTLCIHQRRRIRISLVTGNGTTDGEGNGIA
jgi:hypothetical protein